MNSNNIINAINNINDKYIEEFADTDKIKKKSKFYLSPKFYGSIAAVAVLSAGIYIALSKPNSTDFSQNNNMEITSSTYVPQTNNNNDFNAADNTEKNSDQTNFTNDAECNIMKPFSIKVYAVENSENAVEILPNKSVKIKGDFSPLLSSSRGLGIEFEITCPSSGLTLRTDNGHFVSWDRNSGAITNYGSECSISGTANIFWTFYSNSFSWDEHTKINVFNSNNNIISVINITGDESTYTFSATLQNE